MEQQEKLLYDPSDHVPSTPKMGLLEDSGVSEVCGKFAKGASIRYTKADTQTFQRAEEIKIKDAKNNGSGAATEPKSAAEPEAATEPGAAN
jgi:hypothetical protein